ncbi:MAG TPA: HAD family phosphatase [Polyangia bacterium]|nr:HAD family phosphatase [Polyangia bacterium]
MLRATLIDLDGTLVDTERENAESVARALSRHGRPMSERERAFVVGHGWREIYSLIEHNQPSGFSFAELLSAAAAEKADLLRAQGLRVLPGAREATLRLAARGPVGCVTGSSREEAELVLELAGLRALLDCLITTEDVACGKPQPDGFLKGAERLGVEPARCLAVEDSQAGIAAARAAGMRCVAVQAGNFLGQDQTAADLIVPTLHDLDEALLDRLALAPARRGME